MKSVATLLSLFIYALAFSQVDQNDSSFNCIVHWKKGEEKVLLIHRNKASYQSGNLKSDFNFSYEAFITVLDSSKEGYTIQWVFHLPEAVKKAEPGLAELMPVYEGLKMIFTTTDLGTFKGLLNWQEVRDAYVNMMEVSLPKNMDDKAKETLDKTKQLFSTKEMVEGALIKEIVLYHSLYGAMLTTTGSIRQTSLPSPFSADSLPATITQKITELAPQLDYVKISIDQQIEMGSAGKIIEGLLGKMNIPQDSVVVKAKELLSEFEIKDHSEYIVTQSTGWIKRLYYQRTGKTSEMSRKDSFIIEIE